MTMEKALSLIEQRIFKKDNSQKLEDSKEESFGVYWHYNRAEDMLKEINSAKDDQQKKYYESNFRVSIKTIEKLFEEQKWK